jgi:hypothetical protein
MPGAPAIVRPDDLRIAGVAHPHIEDAIHHQDAARLGTFLAVASSLHGCGAEIDSTEVRRRARDHRHSETQLDLHRRIETAAIAIRGVLRVVVAPGHGPIVAVDRLTDDGGFRSE